MSDNFQIMEDLAGKKIYIFDSVASTFDNAFALAGQGRLGTWDSVLARCQTAGIGQLRRKWQSPPGNLYVSLRLPPFPPFDSTAAAGAFAFLCVAALRQMGIAAYLKWPNDIVLKRDGPMAKVGGVLLEERGGVLLAGLGINIRSAPEILRQDAAMPATSLDTLPQEQFPQDPVQFWKQLLARICGIYDVDGNFAENWTVEAGKFLVWLGLNAHIVDGQVTYSGIFQGISASGCAILEHDGQSLEVCGGSMYRDINWYSAPE